MSSSDEMPVEGGVLPGLLDCANCHKSPRAAGVKALKRCGGCSLAAYCSKECQKAAWPKHKQACRSIRDMKSANGPTAFAGYGTAVHLANATKEWLNFRQQCTLRILARAIVLMRSTIESALASSQLVIVSLAPGVDPNSPDWNPGKAFRVVGADLWDKATLARRIMLEEKDWDEWMYRCRKIGENFQRKEPTAYGHAFAGMIPTAFLFEDNGVSMFNHFPIYHVNNPDAAASLDEHSRACFAEIANMCIGALNSGYMFHAFHTIPYEPLVAVHVHQRGKWRWNFLDDFDWDNPPRSDTKPRQSDANGRPWPRARECWALYHRL